MVIYFHYIIPGNEVVIFQPLKLVKVQFKKKHPANSHMVYPNQLLALSTYLSNNALWSFLSTIKPNYLVTLQL